MADVKELEKLKVAQLRELAAKHGVEVADDDKKDDLVLKVSEAITPEDLEAYNTTQPDGSQDGVEPSEVTGDDGAKGVETEPGTSEEEKAAEKAGVAEERLDNPKQNREPKNGFEQENQKATEQERQAAQKASDVTTKNKVENALTPAEGAATDAEQTASANQSSEIAAAIADGFRRSKDDSFALQEEPGIEHRFALVRNKQTGEVMIRENETGTLSKIQLLSLEEKEASVQNTEVEEL